MIQIGETLVSLDLIEHYFLCDINKCKGACCIEGDSGAPLEQAEVAEMEKVLPYVWDDLSPAAQEVIKKQGVSYVDEDGDLVSSIVNNKDCVFTCYDKQQTCMCAIEKAHRAGLVDFYKPISCHLYPVRITKYDTFDAINIHRWDICRIAEVAGRRAKLRAFRFLKTPLVRKYGEAWYKELEEIGEAWLKSNPKK